MILTQKEERDVLLSYFDISPLMAELLILRGIDSPKKAFSFFYADIALLYTPFLLPNIDAAVYRIKRAIENKEIIGIFADSDIDGLTSLSILAHLFDLLGITYYYRYPIESELYGLTTSVIDEFKYHGVTCVITVDSGIRDVSEIAYANSLGIDVIVCDHHEPSSQIPEAIIVNPKLPDSLYPCKDLSGVGVTFKLCIALLLSYTRYYDRPIILLSGQADSVKYGILKKGILVHEGTLTQMDDIYHLLQKNQHATVITSNLSDVIKEQLPVHYDITSFNFNESYTQPLLKTNVVDVFSSDLEYMMMVIQKMVITNSKKISSFIQDTLPLVAIGTIADMMPVVDENRLIVKAGLQYMDLSNHCGLKIIKQFTDKTITADTISWDISPLLNTPGRFGKTQLAADLFLGKNEIIVAEVFDQIVQLNNERKNIIQNIVAKYSHSDDEAIEIIVSDEIPEGMTGLVANRIADLCKKPTLVVANNSNTDTVKGSGRVHGDFDFFSIISEYSHLFEKLGGHTNAFGFSIKRDNLPILIEKLKNIVLNIRHNTCVEKIVYDIEVPLSNITFDFVKEIQLFEPYGIGNKPFIFYSRQCKISNVYVINNRHYKIIFDVSIPLEGIIWNGIDLYKDIHCYTIVDICYTVRMNEFNNLLSPLLVIHDIKPSQNDV